MKLILLLTVIIAALALATGQSSCKKAPPVVRDYTWRGYNELFNGYAYKNTRIIDSIFKTEKMPTLGSCFRNCADSRTPPNDCLTFSYELRTKKCRMSNRTIPYDPTDPREMATAQRWCPKKGFTSGWVIDMYD